MSVFFCILRGESDILLQWPFGAALTFTLMDQSDETEVKDIAAYFEPHPVKENMPFLGRPSSLRNPSLGKYSCSCCHSYYLPCNPANTTHLCNICTMLGQRHRCWADIVQMLFKCFVFAGKLSYSNFHPLEFMFRYRERQPFREYLFCYVL